MQSTFTRAICRILVPALLSLTFHSAHAGIIATDSAAAAAAAQSDRAVVVGALSRSEVSSQLQAQGIDPSVALQRVAVMTDEEVHTLATGITAAPVGGNGAWAAVIVLGLVAWYVFYRK